MMDDRAIEQLSKRMAHMIYGRVSWSAPGSQEWHEMETSRIIASELRSALPQVADLEGRLTDLTVVLEDRKAYIEKLEQSIGTLRSQLGAAPAPQPDLDAIERRANGEHGFHRPD